MPRGPLPWQPDFPTRFWAKVDRSGECWEWLGFKDSDGYGKMWDGETQEMAHRSAVRLNGGVIPPDYTIDHLCRNRGCVNPAHLEPVTRGENTLRGEGLSARNARKTHCVHGHEFTPENTLPSTDGARRCRTCKDAWGARRSQRNKERRYAA